jgi:hypothetical protein
MLQTLFKISRQMVKMEGEIRYNLSHSLKGLTMKNRNQSFNSISKAEAKYQAILLAPVVKIKKDHLALPCQILGLLI